MTCLTCLVGDPALAIEKNMCESVGDIRSCIGCLEVITQSHSIKKSIVTTAQRPRLNRSPTLGGECRKMLPSGSLSVNIAYI